MRVLRRTFWIAALLAGGCGKSPAPSAVEDPSAAEESHSVRIVSFSPAISRTLVDLELDQFVVGRTPFCDSLDRAVPIVGDLLDVDFETLVRVRPTHVFVQPSASGVNPQLSKLAQRRGWSLHAWQLDSMTDIGALIRDIPTVLFEIHSETKRFALQRAGELLSRLIELAREYDLDVPDSPRTLLLFGVDPVAAFGTETYLHELFMLLGGRNATNATGYPQFTLEDVVRINPEALILVKPYAPSDVMKDFGPLVRMDIDAVKKGRMAILSHPDALLPSSAIIEVAEELRAILASWEDPEL